jgi:hypothetical protein
MFESSIIMPQNKDLDLWIKWTQQKLWQVIQTPQVININLGDIQLNYVYTQEIEYKGYCCN